MNHPNRFSFFRKDSEKLYGINPKTLANMASLGKGPRFRMVGKRAIYVCADFETWLLAYLEKGGE